MGHFGLICPELTGHLNPMTALGRELKRSGHNITLIGRPDAQKKTESAGLEFAVVGEQEFPVGSLAQTTAQLGRLAGLKAIRLTAELLRRAAITILDQASDAIASAGGDALLVDQVTPSRRDGRGDTPFTVCFGLQCTGVKSGSSPAAGSDTVAISSRHHLALAQRARRLHSADSRPPDHSRD